MTGFPAVAADDGSGPPPRCGGWWPRRRCVRASWCCRCSWPRGSTSRGRSASMPGVVQHSRASLRKAAVEAVEAGVGGLMLFGIPTTKDAVGSGGLDPEGILNVAIADVVAEVGDATVVMSDLCLDEFTDHGHCGVLAEDGSVDNDATLEQYAAMAVAQADAGVHMVGPSGMMDGQVGGDPLGARRRRPPRHRDPGVLREVCLGVLRAVPRGGVVVARGRPPDLPAGLPQRSRGDPRSDASTWPRAPTW